MNKPTGPGYLFFILMLLVPLAAGATGDEPKAFVKGSFAEIVSANADRPFIVSLWSVDCPPCIRELKLWSELQTRYPEMELVLISTDGVDARQTINALLQKTGNLQRESWVFADEFEARLRFEIDPQWYGELPRTIFFGRDHRRHGVSGQLKREQIEQWLMGQEQ
jgi:thiol-disulfide isomerase/thioredoxin